MERHYGLDWLRVGAFGLLILYHVGMVFVPWDFHVKTTHPIDWVAIPMHATNSWRLMLLFVVSGYASRALLKKSNRVGNFVGSRSKRLLVPLLFGVIVVVPIQPWVELITQHGYDGGFGWFWLHDYFRFGTFHNIVLPTWQHMWFVGYLWFYTMTLAAAVWLLRGHGLQAAFDRVFCTVALMLLPIAWLFFVDMYLLPGARETHDLLRDPIAHAHYLPAFLFGFALARSTRTMAAIDRWWKAAGIIALLSYAVVAAIELRWPGSAMPYPYGYVFASARVIQGWCAIVALIGLAERYWNRDHHWRWVLTEAVFPFYMIHQTIIVTVEWALLPYGLPPAAEFAILVASTIAGCWAFYLVGREVGWLRPLIGLRGIITHRHEPRPARLTPAETL